MKITDEHSIFNGVTRDEILDYLNRHPENFNAPVILYAADDFDDFVSVLKDIEIQHGKTNKNWHGKDKDKVIDVMWNKFHEVMPKDKEDISFFVEQREKSLKVKDFIEKLKQIELADFQITASTEHGRIYFLVSDIQYRQVKIPGFGTVLMLVGTF